MKLEIRGLIIFTIALLLIGVVHGEVAYVNAQVNTVSLTSTNGEDNGGSSGTDDGDGYTTDSSDTNPDSGTDSNTDSDEDADETLSVSVTTSASSIAMGSNTDKGNDTDNENNSNTHTNTVRTKVVSVNKIHVRNIQPVNTPILVREKISEKLKEKIIRHVKLDGNNIENNMLKVKEQIKVKIQKVEEKSTDAKNSYKVAKQNYLKNKNTGLALGHAKTMMQSGSKFVLSWLDRIELKVLETDGMDDDTKVSIIDRINEYREGIQELEEKMNNTSDISELRELSKEINDYWKEIKLFITSVTYQLSIAKLNVIIANSEEVELRIQEKITELQKAGEDTTKLEELLSKYQENIEMAEEKIDEANDILSAANSIADINEGRRLILEATKYIKDAFKDIRGLINEYKRYRIQSGMVLMGNQTGELYAKGDGYIEIEGSGVVVAKGNGTITVTPETAVISSVGNGKKAINNNTVSIEGRETVTVRGEDIEVIIEGTDLQVFAKGTGSAYLEGEGTYKVKKLPGDNMTEFYYDGSIEVEFGGE